jgi:hypothetical protein
MNTLEDAFINIGMDEQKFLKNQEDSTAVNASKLSELKIPECLSKGKFIFYFVYHLLSNKVLT